MTKEGVMRRWVSLLALLALLAAPGLAAADEGSTRTSLGLESGFMKLVGGELDLSNTDHHLGLNVRQGIAPHWSLEFALKYGWVRPAVGRPTDSAGLTFDTSAPLYTVIWQPRLGVLWHPLPMSGLSPFLGLSAGVTSWRVKDLTGISSIGLNPGGATVIGLDKNGNQTSLKGNDFTGTLTAGADVYLSPSLAMSFGGRYHLFPGNKLDNVGFSDSYRYYGRSYGVNAVDANTGLVEAFLGMTLFLGSADRDHDGIADHVDLCPNDPEDFDGFEDEDGCPDTDNDKDGIVDVRDKCPNQPEDIDGYEDADGCPDLDNDKDGIPDLRDKCPDDPEDFDNYQDEDGCPDPDNDNDGVLDAYDQCPDTPDGTEVDAKGCPVARAAAPAPVAAPAPSVPAPQEIKQDLVLKGVTFVTGSASLKPESQGTLREVSRSLLAYPDVKVEIRGYTDNVGSADTNRNLSQRRALAVRDFLIQMGVMPSRLTAVGYGPDNPIASNDTPAGRAENRRVELHRVN